MTAASGGVCRALCVNGRPVDVDYDPYVLTNPVQYNCEP